jgi:hypothetical protein
MALPLYHAKRVETSILLYPVDRDIPDLWSEEPILRNMAAFKVLRLLRQTMDKLQKKEIKKEKEKKKTVINTSSFWCRVLFEKLYLCAWTL